MRRSDKNRLKAEQIKQAKEMCDAMEDTKEEVIIFDEASGRQVGKSLAAIKVGKSLAAIKVGKYILQEMERVKEKQVAHEREMHRLLSKQHRSITKFK